MRYYSPQVELMATTQTLLTLEEFAALPEEEGVLRELDEGVVIEVPRGSVPHGRVQSGQVLEEPGLLPGFSVPVDELFAGV